MANITIQEAAKRYGVSELCIWGLIRQKLISSSLSPVRKLVQVRSDELAEYMKKHPKELKVWSNCQQGKPRKIWEVHRTEGLVTYYTNGISVFSDEELSERVQEPQTRNKRR